MVGPVRTTSRWARERFTAALVARLATVDDHMQPHIVPFVFAVIDDVIYSAVDGKPKSGQPLRRLDNIAHNPRVSALVDHYADDWNDLWWARADGTARLVDMDSEEATRALIALGQRYPDYQRHPPPGPVLAIHVLRWSGWMAQEGSRQR